MDAKALLEFQLGGSFRLLAEVIGEMTDAEWTSRPYPRANLLGFTAWHGARTIDWAVNRVARGTSELADREGWLDLRPAGSLFGAGVPADRADAIAHEVSRARTSSYVDTLRAEAMDWLATLPAETLSRSVDLKASGGRDQEYMAPAVWAEISDLNGIPLWQFLARPSGNHIRVHYGEMTAHLEAMRARS